MYGFIFSNTNFLKAKISIIVNDIHYFSFILFLKTLNSWTSHRISPIIDGFILEQDETFQVLLLNKFEKNVSKDKLSLLIWSFDVELFSLSDTDDKIIVILLNEYEKTGLPLKQKALFLKINFQWMVI